MIPKLPYALLVLGMAISGAVPAGELAPPSTPGDIVSAPGKAETRADRPVFVTVAPVLGTLKRAPVMFKHDKHTAALKDDGCEICHPRQAGKFEFSFPKVRDESSRGAVMNAYHEACIDCHTKRAGENKKAGPVTCGECHAEKKAYHPQEYLPVLPEYYSALRDTYHKDCIACHRQPAKPAKEAGALDWKKFYVKAKAQIELEWPRVVYDHLIHSKHEKALEKKCELCHYLPPELKQKIAAEGREPTGQEWLRTEEEGRSLKKREEAHRRCLNCHLERLEAKTLHGPLDCKDCHLERLRTVKELENVPPTDYGKKERILMKPAPEAATQASVPEAESGTQASVPFDHKAHIAASRACTDCHHDTVEPCQKCHTLKGAKEGKFITLAEAHHKSGSTWSCVGCHEQEQQKPDCAGCHHLRKGGLAGTDCAACHTGKLESLDQAVKLPDPATVFPRDLKDDLEISLLEKEYETTKVKHKEIVRKLTEISNNSKLATYFHKDETTLCSGCHHMGAVEKGKKVPACSSCHTIQNEPSGNTPTLLGAYHLQCLGCHKAMGHPEEKMPQDCTGCHKEKKNRP